jgi:hypothetical protein
LLNHVETALLAEIDIDECYVGPQVLDTLQPVCGGGCHRNHADSLMLEQPCRGIEEVAVVVENHATRALSRAH